MVSKIPRGRTVEVHELAALVAVGGIGGLLVSRPGRCSTRREDRATY
jgi:hypothetical protein